MMSATGKFPWHHFLAVVTTIPAVIPQGEVILKNIYLRYYELQASYLRFIF